MTTARERRGSRAAAWGRLGVGLTVLAAVVSFLASGITPPGVFGEVLRHNQDCGIDASPLFYSEVEHMACLEAGVAALRREASFRDRAGAGDGTNDRGDSGAVSAAEDAAGD